MKLLFTTLLIFAAFSVSGCSNPAKTITRIFQQMSAIAAASPDNCDEIGTKLSAYLRENSEPLRKAVLDASNASPEDAMHIYSSSFELHQKTEHCNNESMIQFRKELSEIILQNPI